MAKLIFLLKYVFIFNLYFSQIVFAETIMRRPDPEFYKNPYTLITESKIKTLAERWTVYCNRDQAPLLTSPNGIESQTTNYLEPFYALEKKGKYLLVRSRSRNGITGWIDMKHLILIDAGIRDPSTNVYYKGFIKVKIEKLSEESSDLLRFRDQPGDNFNFITEKDDIDRVSNLFYYVYAVHFDDKNIDYQETNQFKNAKYFLLGETSTVSIGDVEESATKKSSILSGWIPNKAVVLWDTRQALEKVPDRPQKDFDAHIFPERKILNQYFCGNKDKKEEILKNYEENIIIDHGEGPPKDGQTLRYINLAKPDNIEDPKSRRIIGKSAFIGYTGQALQIGTSVSDGGSIHSILADFQEGSKYLEIFFLIDATLSMKPCLEAASSVTRELIVRLAQRHKINNLSVYGAVYRDKKDGGKRWYEECGSSDPDSVADFFSNVREYSHPKDDYPEDLFNGISASIDKWKIKKFKHKFSTRVMFILGDAGDNGRNNFTEIDCSDLDCPDGKKSITRKFIDNGILPITIHILHDHKNSDEKTAMDNFPKQMSNVMRGVYTDPFFQKVYSIPKSPEGEISKEYVSSVIGEYVPAIARHVKKLKNDLPSIRRGKKRYSDSMCEDEYRDRPDLINGCKKCCSMNELENFVRNHPLDAKIIGGLKISRSFIGFPIAKINLFARKNPELADIIFKRPELAFGQGYVVLKKEGFITQPILLLSERELLTILSYIRNLPRNCSSKGNYGLIVQAMTALIGELMNYPPSVPIPEEKLRDGLKVRIKSPGSFIGAEEIVKNLCSDDIRWSNFRNRLDEVIREIENTVYDTKTNSRLYRDIHNTNYYWYRPDELFPMP